MKDCQWFTYCNILPLFLVDKQDGDKVVGGEDFKEKQRNAFKSNSSPGSFKVPKVEIVSGFFCVKHGGNKSNYNAKNCRSKLNNFESDNKPNRATNSAVTMGLFSVSSGVTVLKTVTIVIVPICLVPDVMSSVKLWLHDARRMLGFQPLVLYHYCNSTHY